jgi:hypothetical protein
MKFRIAIKSRFISFFRAKDDKTVNHHKSNENYKNKLALRLVERVEKDLSKGNILKAISRYEGFFQYHTLNQTLHDKVAKLYIEIGDYTKAGKHLFFKQNPSKQEKKCIYAFKKSCGNSATLLLKKLLPKENFSIKKADTYTKTVLKKLLKEAKQEIGQTPNFLKGIDAHFEKIKRIKK